MEHFDRYYRVQIVSADVPFLITQLSLNGVELQNIEFIDILTVKVSIKHSCYRQMRKVIIKSGASCQVIKKEGKRWILESVLRRPMLLFGLLLFLIAAIIIPNRIFFYEVTGNVEVSEQYILMNAEECGVKFGRPASDINSEELKNKLLESMPQLQWVGITIKGSVAQIHVMERSAVKIEDKNSKIVSSIVSACDGVITEQTVYEGNPMFQVGDAVQSGDVLVSGYIDCGIKIRTCQADAEIYALTMRKMQFLTPSPSMRRGSVEGRRTCYKLRVGKKVINFCNHSGIMDAGCVKMYLEDYWTLPGGFHLPVSIIKITYSDHEILQASADEFVSQWIPQFAQKYLRAQMVSGKVISEELLWEKNENVNSLTGIYACHEMIGREKYEGIID